MNMQNAEACLPLCAHIYLYFDAAKFSIKLFSFIYFTVSVRTMEWIWNSDWSDPLRLVYITTSSPFQDINLHKNPDNRAVVWLNQMHIR